MVSKEGPSVNNPLQLSTLGADCTNAAEVHSGINIDPVILVGPKRSALTETTALTILCQPAHITEVMTNSEPSPYSIGIDSTPRDIPPFTQRRGSPPGAGVPNVDNLIVSDASLSTTTPQVPLGVGVSVLGSTPPDSPTPMMGPGSKDLTDASSEADLSDYLSCTPEDESGTIHQTDGQAKLNIHSVSLPTLHTTGEPIPPIIEESSASLMGGSPPVTENLITAADVGPNPLPTGDPVHLRTDRWHPGFVESTSILTLDPQPPSQLCAVGISEMVCTETPRTVQNNDSSASQGQCGEEQDEQDEMVVDALLTVPSELNTTFNPLCGTTKFESTSREGDGSSVHTPIPEVSATDSTDTPHDPTPDICNSSTVVPVPSTFRQPQRDPDVLQESPIHAPFHHPRDMDCTPTMPLSNVESVAHDDSGPVHEGHHPHGNLIVPGLGSRAFRFRTGSRVSFS